MSVAEEPDHIPTFTEDHDAWRYFSLCRGMASGDFFPMKNESTTRARNACNACPVRKQCLDCALEGDEKYGIWGGTTERDRRILKRRRRSAK